MGALYSDLAYVELQKLRAGQLKYAWDASLAGSKLQSYPLRIPQKWILGAEPLSLQVEPSSLGIGVVIGLLLAPYLSKYLKRGK